MSIAANPRLPLRRLARRVTVLLAASVAPLALVAALGPALADSIGNNGGNGGNAPNTSTPGGGGGGGAAGDGSTTAPGGGGGATGGAGNLGGGGGASDSGGGGGAASGLAAGGGGGGAGGAGMTMTGTVNISEIIRGGNGGNGGFGAANWVQSWTIAGGGGGGGGGSGIIVTTGANLTNTGTITGGNGGGGADVTGPGVPNSFANPVHNGVGGRGGNGVTATASAGLTIVNSGTISGGGGGSDYQNFQPYRLQAGGHGIIGQNLTITNSGSIVGGELGGAGFPGMFGTRATAIIVTGGVNSITALTGSNIGAIELGGQTTLAGTFNNTIQVNGGVSMLVTGADATGNVTGITTLNNHGAITIGAGRTLSASTLNNHGGSISLGVGATLQGTGNTLNNNATINVATGGAVSDAGDINNFSAGFINFNGPGGTATLSSGTSTINNSGQINVVSGDVDAVGGNITNHSVGAISVTGGNFLGIGTFTHAGSATLNVAAGCTLDVNTIAFVGGSVSGTGTIDAATAFTLTASGSISTILAGTGALSKSGATTTTLTGANTYSGNTTVSAGTLALSGAGTLGAVSGSTTISGGTLSLGGTTQTQNGGLVMTGGTLADGTFSSSGTMDLQAGTISAALAGTGAAVKSGVGTVALRGMNTYSGGTTINGGTLEIGTIGTSGAIVGTVNVVAGTLDLINADMSGVTGITNSATVNYRNATNAGSGTVTTNAGATTSFFDTASGGTASFVTNAGGTVDISGLSSAGMSAGSIAGGGVYLLGSKTLTVGGNNASTTVTGTISDGGAGGGAGGSLSKTGSGILTLSGNSTYTGATTVDGGTLRAGAANAFAAGSAHSVAAGAMLDLGGHSQTIGSLAGAGSVLISGSSDITLTSGGNNASTTFSGLISNGGTGNLALAKTGSGTLTLSGSNTYSGGTTVLGGAVAVSQDSNLGSAGGVLTLNGGTLQFTSGFELGATRAVTLGAGNGTVDTGANSATIAGAITGAGSLAKAGSGTLTLSGASSYSGSTAVNAGAFNITGSLADAGATIANGTTADVNGSGAAWTSIGAFNIDGGFSVQAGATVESGSANLGTGGGQSGAATVTGAGSTWTIDTDLDVGDAGAGFLTVAGGAVVSADAVTIGRTGGSSGSVTLTTGGQLTANTLTIASAPGAAGVLNVGAAAGDPAAAAGALNVSSLTLGQSNGSVVFNHTGANHQFASAITGAGSVNHIAGTTVLTGASTYTGATTVSGGTLRVNGTIASSSGITVDAGATIGGAGTIASTLVNGTLSIGNSAGTLTVAGNLTLGAGSTSVFELGAPGVVGGAFNDLVHVTGDLALGGTLTAPGAVSGYYRLFDVDGAISGSYAAVPADAVIQTGIANQVNMLISSSGQMVQFWDGADASGNGTVDGGAGTWSAGGTNWTGAPGSAGFNDQWRGEVGVFAGTAGTVTVSGPIDFEGLQFSTDGYTLAGDTLTMVGNSAGNAFASFITVDGGVNATIESELAGCCIGLDKLGNGTLTLTGINSYTGATTISAGTLALSGNGDISSSSLVTVDSIFDISDSSWPFAAVNALAGASTGRVELGGVGLVVFNASTEFAGTIAGTGGLEIFSGTQTLSGVNTYTNATQIDTGATLALKGSGSIADSAFVGLMGAATFDISQTTTGTTVAGLYSLSAPSTVALGSKTLTLTNGSSFRGSITDGGIGGGVGGSLVIANGASQELTGNNTFTGSTTIEVGGVLQLAASGNLSESSGIVANGEFDISDHLLGMGPAIKSLSGAGDVYLGDRNLRITAANGTFSGAISDCGAGGLSCLSGLTGGSLTLQSGTLTLSGASTYSGGTTVGNFGGPATAFLVAANNSAVGTGRVLLNEGGVFRAGADGLVLANDFAVSASLGTVDSNGHTMTITGTISDQSDPGTFHKSGAGTLILTGANTYGDGTVVNQGTLQIGNGGATGSILGDVAVGDTLAFNRSDAFTFSGVISDKGGDAGRVIQRGSGTLLLTASNTHTGGTIAEAGTLSLTGNDVAGTGAITGRGGAIDYAAGVTIANPLVLDAASTRLQVLAGLAEQAGNISETGGPRNLEKTGAGTLLVSGNATYTGSTTVSAGTLRAAKAGTFAAGSAFTVGAGATLDLGGFNQTLGGLSGPGNAAMGAGNLTVNQTGTTEFSGAISGSGTFAKAGAGKLVLSGTSTFTGPTLVNGGLLTVNGDITSSSLVTVNAGGALGGNGRLPTVNLTGGTLAPGNSIGTLTVAGNLTFGTGSTYAVEVDNVSSDRTNVTGTANLSGGTVATSFAPVAYVQKTYTILTAQGGLGGTTFAGLTGTAPAGFTRALTYDGTNANLVLDLLMRDPDKPVVTPDPDKPVVTVPPTVPSRPTFPLLNRNQRSVANSIVDYFDANGRVPSALGALDPAGLSLASGEAAAGAMMAGSDATDRFLALIGEQAVAKGLQSGMDSRAFETRWQGWSVGHGGAATTGGDAATGSHDTRVQAIGIAGGIATQWDGTFIGLAIGGTSSSFGLSDGLGGGDASSFNAGAYARHDFGRAYIAAAAAYGFHETDTSRSVSGSTLTGDFTAHSFSGRIEAGYDFDVGLARITPYAAFQALSYRMPAYVETGAWPFALTYQGQSLTTTRTEIGARIDRSFSLDNDATLILSGRAALAINGGDAPGYVAGFQSLPGTSVTIAGVNPDDTSALVDAGAEYRSKDGFFAALGFQGEFSGNVRSVSGKAKIGFTW